MPEGPSIIILKEAVQPFLKKKITAVSGNTKIEKERMLNKKVVAFRSWGNNFLFALMFFPCAYISFCLVLTW